MKVDEIKWLAERINEDWDVAQGDRDSVMEVCTELLRYKEEQNQCTHFAGVHEGSMLSLRQAKDIFLSPDYRFHYCPRCGAALEYQLSPPPRKKEKQ